MTLRVLFIGGTGEISLACVEEAKRTGHAITVYNRGRTRAAALSGIEQMTGDFNDDASFAALAGGHYDVVCQFLAFDEKAVERDINVFSGHCGQYIFISTASAYQKPCPSPLITEDTPLDNPYWEYSRRKAACEGRLMAAHQAGQLPVTIVRPSHTYRARLPSTVIHGDHLAWRLLRDKPLVVHGDGESVWTLTHADDFARAFVRLFSHKDAFGEAFHITDNVGYTWNNIIKAVSSVIGKEPGICNVLSTSLVGYEKSWEGPLLGDKSNTMLFDTQKISRLAGDWHCTISLDEGIKRTWPFVVERLEKGYEPDMALDALIDRIIEDHT